MQSLSIDLVKSPDIAAEVADLEPGDRVTLHATIKSLDPQTLVVTVEELEIPSGEETDEEMSEADALTAPGIIVMEEEAGV
jgi:hypothetical protein